MKWICLLLPACVSMKISYQRNGNQPLSENALFEVFRWGCWVIVNNILTMITMLFVFKHGSIVVEVFESFGFSLKYMVVSLAFACVLPYIFEILKKYVAITFSVGE